jgi:uncharacterized protein YigA (DUF484 family)
MSSNIDSPVAPITSFADARQRKLEADLTTVQQQLADYVAAARANQATMETMLALLVKLALHPAEARLNQLVLGLRDVFGLELVQVLSLAERHAANADVRVPTRLDSDFAALQDVLAAGDALWVGRLPHPQRSPLLREVANDYASAATLWLAKSELLIVLASTSEHRFNPSQDSWLLGLMARHFDTLLHGS